MGEEDTETILEFAECIDPTELFNCSVPTINKFCTIDGTCNNLLRPLQGASNTEFRRILPAQYEDGISVPIDMINKSMVMLLEHLGLVQGQSVKLLLGTFLVQSQS